jgi:hypothetical protein
MKSTNAIAENFDALVKPTAVKIGGEKKYFLVKIL